MLENAVSLRCAILYFVNQSNFILPDHPTWKSENEISSKKSRDWNLRMKIIIYANIYINSFFAMLQKNANGLVTKKKQDGRQNGRSALF